VQLEIDTDKMPLFVGGVRVRHEINKQSPLYGLCTPADVFTLGITSVTAVVQGHDDVYSQVVSASHVFGPEHIIFNHRYRRMLEESDKGTFTVHFERLNAVVCCDADDGSTTPSSASRFLSRKFSPGTSSNKSKSKPFCRWGRRVSGHERHPSFTHRTATPPQNAGSLRDVEAAGNSEAKFTA
jgi:hypothetical protein